MRYLFAATCLTPVALLAAPAAATTVISGSSTTPIKTSTANNGAPDSVQVATGATLKPTTSPAVTVDSNNDVDNEGTIQITDVNNAVGILVQAGRTTNITNGGNIQIDETFTAADTNGDGILDPPYASGTGRFGIHALGAMTGNIVNSGTIIIKGNNSAGIALDGTLTGSLTSSGSISVLGNDGFGIHANDVSGTVSTGVGAISVTGQNSIGVALDGNIGGQAIFEGGVSATGFATTAVTTNTADLLLGGPAVRIQGNVGGGILFTAVPVTSTTVSDVNNDGIADSVEGTASITSFGSAPAVQIGSASHAITIGAVAASGAGGAGIFNEGTITGNGLDAGFTGTGMQIGGLGGAVTVTGGLNNTGSIAASALDSNATALRIGSGATVSTIVNSGNISSTSSPTTASVAVQGVSIDAGGKVTSITNSGTIGAQITGSAGTATAIADRSGTLNLIQNQGSIITSVTSGATGIAIDLRANTTGATVRQLVPASSTVIPLISGDILFGGGSNVLDIEAGTFTGNTVFGGSNNQVTLAGSAQQMGNIDFGGTAGSLTLNGTALFQGSLANSAAVAVAVNGGTLNVTNSGTVSLASLNVGGQGSFTVNINGATGAHTLYQVGGAATFAAGAKVNVKLTSVGGSDGDFLILHAGSLTGANQLTSTDAVVPFLFSTSLSVDQAAGDISLEVHRKTAAELGLNRSESAIFNAAVQAVDSDSGVAGVFLDAQDAGTLQNAFRQLLPDHAGAVFQSVAQSSRAEIRALSDPLTPLIDMGSWGVLLQQVAWGENKGQGDTDSYRIVGWGVGVGPEFKIGSLGSVGLTFSYLSGSEKSGAVDDQVSNNEYELAAYWRGHWGGLHAFGRVSGGYVTFDSKRFFLANDGTISVSRTAKGSWRGWAATAAAGLSYEVHSGRFSIRPAVSLDYIKLKENNFTETGGGNAFDLAVDARNNHEEGVNATLALGYDLVRAATPDASRVRIEIEGGRRELIDKAAGTTTAHFAGGSDFTLLGDARDSGWLGRFRLLAGSADFQAGAEVGTEEQQGRQAVSLRASIQVHF
ncbi:MAG TPA: autotransporter domain-containing protein [Allosphingosinicella sp.]|jgi:hypothetical protein